MKNLRHILPILAMIIIGCEKQEPVHRITYEFNPEQETIIEVDVIPVGDVEMKEIDMLKEVNADYYNRYGVGIRINFFENIPVPQDLIDEPETVWWPKGPDYKITAYVINEQYIRLPGATAYLLRYTGNRARAMAVIGEHSQTNGTFAHELGHAFSLDHVQLNNNVMKPHSRARQYDVPNDFVEAQIDTIMGNIDLFDNKLLSSKVKEEFILIID